MSIRIVIIIVTHSENVGDLCFLIAALRFNFQLGFPASVSEIGALVHRDGLAGRRAETGGRIQSHTDLHLQHDVT